MSPYAPEPRRCAVPRAHRKHDYLDDQGLATECPGLTHAPTLAHLLDRRPDLADLTPVTVANRIQVMNA